MGEIRVDVIGGGFSGMAAAWYLQKAGARVRLFERAPCLGGLICTLHTPYGLVEQAASGLLGSREVENLFSELGIRAYPTVKKYKRRYIYRSGPSFLPLRGWEWVRVLKIFRERLRGFAGLRPLPEETLRQWSLRHWGKSLTDGVVEPAFRGVFACTADQLSATLVLKGMMTPLARSHGLRGTVAPLGGMDKLIGEWTVQLLRSGVEIHLNSDWRDDGRAQKVVLCLSPQESGQYLQNAGDSRFLKQLTGLPRVGLVSVTAFFDPSARDLRGFGVLSPVQEGLGAMGVLFQSDIFWERQGHLRSERYIFEEKWLEKSDEEILSQVLCDRKLLQDGAAEPRSYFITRKRAALPQYGIELERFLSTQGLSRGRYQLFGNSYGELGLARILDAAKLQAPKWMAEVSHG